MKNLILHCNSKIDVLTISIDDITQCDVDVNIEAACFFFHFYFNIDVAEQGRVGCTSTPLHLPLLEIETLDRFVSERLWFAKILYSNRRYNIPLRKKTTRRIFYDQLL